MTKAERNKYLRDRYYALFGAALMGGFIPVTRAEISTEAQGLRKTYVTRTNDRAVEPVTDESEDTREPVALFDAVKDTAERETDILLTVAERRQLAQEKANPRAVIFKVNDLGPEVANLDPEIAALPAREITPRESVFDGVTVTPFDVALADLPLALNP